MILAAVVGLLNWLIAFIVLTTWIYGIDPSFSRAGVGWYHFGVGIVFLGISAILADTND